MDIKTLRHSASHVLAQAVKHLYPKVKLGIGPSTEDGFYYDFDIKTPFIPEDLVKIENEMKKIISQDQKFQKKEITKQQAKKLFKNEKYKLELIKDLKGKITSYTNSDFTDLCSGHHVKSTKDIKAFKLLRVAGAYWKGDSKNKMLQRIYGTAFETEKELKDYLFMMEEAEKRSHIKLGKKLGIFMISDLVGKGLPLWLPKGNIIKEEIEKLAKEKEKEQGYVRVTTPNLAKKELYLKSGHLPYYENSMYPSMKIDDGTYYLKAMNCPHHHLIYKNEMRSYRDLPLRIAEYGTCYRNELSGTLAGLMRVRMLSMNDAHIYCTKDQIEQEFTNVINLVKEYYTLFGLKDYYFRLSKWDPKNKEKYINEPKNWAYSEEVLRKVLKKLNVKFTEADNEAAFYGPKLDIQFKTVTGKEETMSTIQLDFAAKGKFELTYQDNNSKENNEVFVIHRAPLSTHERFIALLIEHYAGKFPLWLSPVQVKIITVTDRNIKYAEALKKELEKNDIRVEIDLRAESISKKIRDAHEELPYYIITIGDREEQSNVLATRTRDNKVINFKKDDLIKDLLDKIKTRSLQ